MHACNTYFSNSEKTSLLSLQLKYFFQRLRNKSLSVSTAVAPSVDFGAGSGETATLTSAAVAPPVDFGAGTGSGETATLIGVVSLVRGGARGLNSLTTS